MATSSPGPSLLVLEELLSRQDPSFVEQVRLASDPKTLASLAERWKRDPRAWARQQVLAYLDLPLDRPGHQVLVKRLFKQAEERGDHEQMAAFMVAFDRLVRRRLVRRHHHDWRARESWVTESLRAPADGHPPVPNIVQRGRQWKREGWNNLATAAMFPGPLFSNPTRNHLRRRVWRHFRRLAHRDASAYATHVAAALARYTDDDLKDGKALLDCWSLVHACFFESPAIEFTPDHARLAEGHALGELSAAPYREQACWADERATEVVVGLLTSARSRPVRTWAMQILRRHHAARLADLPVAKLLAMLDHADEELQQFGASLLASSTGLGRLGIDTWQKLLGTRNLSALALVTEAMRKHVSPARLGLAGAVELAIVRPAPVALLGVEYVGRLIEGRRLTRDELRLVGRLAGAASAAAGRKAAEIGLALVGSAEHYDLELVTAFFDALNAEVRAGAWAWLTAEPRPRGYDDPALWARLIETPFEDLRLGVVEVLRRRAELPGVSADVLAPLWSAVLLGIHRGGRQKLAALRQVSEALAGEPARAPALLPVLAVALRSVRPAEARPGLAAVVRAVEARPEIEPIVRTHLPELAL